VTNRVETSTARASPASVSKAGRRASRDRKPKRCRKRPAR
jgi:hypothetical protein